MMVTTISVYDVQSVVVSERRAPSGQAWQSVEIHGAWGSLDVNLFAQKDRPGLRQLLPPGIYGWIEKRVKSHGSSIGIHGVESITVGKIRTAPDSSWQTISVATADGAVDIYLHVNDVKLPPGVYGKEAQS